ncbi:MAG: hypothetical protein R2860_01975 [Desulfobacterales bacterium]
MKKRKYFCHREVVLNRRLAREVLSGCGSHYLPEWRHRLGGQGPAVEYAVQMRRLCGCVCHEIFVRAGQIDEPGIKTWPDAHTAFYGQEKEDPPHDKG